MPQLRWPGLPHTLPHLCCALLPQETGLDQYAIVKYAEALEVRPPLQLQLGSWGSSAHMQWLLLPAPGCTRLELPAVRCSWLQLLHLTFIAALLRGAPPSTAAPPLPPPPSHHHHTHARRWCRAPSRRTAG